MITWEATTAIAAIVAPLIGIPLTIIMFHLRGLREYQTGRFAELSQRLSAMDAELHRTSEESVSAHKDYAIKEEWLRECAWVRGQIERINASMNRIETQVEQNVVVANRLERTLQQVLAIDERRDKSHNKTEPGTTQSEFQARDGPNIV